MATRVTTNGKKRGRPSGNNNSNKTNDDTVKKSKTSV
jgi:hypothetical protein